LEPAASISQSFGEYRKTIGETLKHTFAGNFAAVVVAPRENGSGLELVVARADMQPTNTIKYGVALLNNGKELLDVTGETAGKTIAMRGNAGDLKAKYDGMIEELTDYTLQSLGEKVYDQIMRAESLQQSGFYESLAKPETAAPAGAVSAAPATTPPATAP
jgi:hypothetical protein